MVGLSFLILIAIWVRSSPALGQVQSSLPDRWVDYASGEYDILPNITYSTANNTELTLDLYLPRDHSRPQPTLVLFHGGGWVAGQRERNVFQLVPFYHLVGL